MKLNISKEQCMELAKREGDAEVGAGFESIPIPRSFRPFCAVCGWRKGGPDSWDGSACKCGYHAEPITLVPENGTPDAK